MGSLGIVAAMRLLFLATVNSSSGLGVRVVLILELSVPEKVKPPEPQKIAVLLSTVLLIYGQTEQCHLRKAT